MTKRTRNRTKAKCARICWDDPDGAHKCDICNARTDDKRCICCGRSTVSHSVKSGGTAAGSKKRSKMARQKWARR